VIKAEGRFLLYNTNTPSDSGTSCAGVSERRRTAGDSSYVPEVYKKLNINELKCQCETKGVF